MHEQGFWVNSLEITSHHNMWFTREVESYWSKSRPLHSTEKQLYGISVKIKRMDNKIRNALRVFSSSYYYRQKQLASKTISTEYRVCTVRLQCVQTVIHEQREQNQKPGLQFQVHSTVWRVFCSGGESRVRGIPLSTFSSTVLLLQQLQIKKAFQVKHERLHWRWPQSNNLLMRPRRVGTREPYVVLSW